VRVSISTLTMCTWHAAFQRHLRRPYDTVDPLYGGSADVERLTRTETRRGRSSEYLVACIVGMDTVFLAVSVAKQT
jgi:hypothetical protein